MSAPFLSEITNFFSSPDAAVDLGTANTRLFAAGKGFLAEMPTKVKPPRRQKHLDPSLSEPEGAAKNKKFIAPVRCGAVVDVRAASRLLRNLLKGIKRFGFIRPRIIVCAPSDSSERERNALLETARRAGARAAAIVPAPLAAAVGAGLNVCSPYAQMIVDIGHGVTDIAVIREGNIIQTATTRVAGSELHKAVQKMAAERYQIRLSAKAAESLICKFGAARPTLHDSLEIGINGSGRGLKATIESREISAAIQPIVKIIAATVNRAVREMSPEACAEVIETGICLTGGVALLPGIAELIAEKTNLPVVLAPAPLYSVIDGAGKMLDVSAQTNLWQN